MFSIWASMQASADQAAQFACLPGKPAWGPANLDVAQRLITLQVLAALRLA
ncbi:hypothetical protein [Roseateles sp.]|uniref:hypothetical protein n=1 Tax=Roseateles sp. TaxID=1971397 RepID=UPI00286A3B76|nr:hypothetical protein [Roseateles sp.]